jgi:hypothetical protein
LEDKEIDETKQSNDIRDMNLSTNCDFKASAAINFDVDFDNISLSKGTTIISSDDSAKISKSRYIMDAIEGVRYPNYRLEMSLSNGYLVVSRCQRTIRRTKIWDIVYIDKILDGYKYIFLKIHRRTGRLELKQTYDIYNEGHHTDGRNGLDLAKALAETSSEFVIVVATVIDCTLNHLKNGLPEEMYRCGASKEVFGSGPLRAGYALLGIPDCGINNGFESKPQISKEGFHEISVDFSIFPNNHNHNQKYWKINEKFSGNISILRSMFLKTTKNENKEWNKLKLKNMPSYYYLCKKEYESLEMKFSGNYFYLNKILILIAIVFGFGHALTDIGRKSIWCIGWKYMNFIKITLGWWTDEMVNLYQVHQVVHETSNVWDDPFVNILNIESEMQINDTAINNENYETNRKQLHVLTEEENKKWLKKDYCKALYAIVATRATILQLIPYVSILSIFASFTASSPLLVQSLHLKENLQDSIIINPISLHIRFTIQHYDRLWKMKEAETNENSYNIQVKVDDEKEIIDIINKKNELSKKRQKIILEEAKFQPRKWEAILSAPYIFLNNSRYILFTKGLFKTIIAVMILYTGKDDNEKEKSNYLVNLSIIVLLPYALAFSLNIMVQIGWVLWITDDELYRELWWIYDSFAFLKKGCLSFCNDNNDTDTDNDDKKSADKVIFSQKNTEAEAIEMHNVTTINPINEHSIA